MWQWFRGLFGPSDPTPAPVEPVVVMICEGTVQASLYLAQLHDAGIPAALLGADSAAMFGMQSGLLADIRIVVPPEHADAAFDLLESITADDTSPDTDVDAEIPPSADIDDSADV